MHIAPKRKVGYTTEIEVYHHETPAKIDLRTGELTELHTPNRKTKAKIPEGYEVLSYTNFSIINNEALVVLKDECSMIELSIIMYMISMVDLNTNSLAPLNNDVSARELGRIFSISDKTATKVFTKLKSIGVYGQWSVEEYNIGHTEYWVMNPHICYRGRLINKTLIELFKNTKLSKLIG